MKATNWGSDTSLVTVGRYRRVISSIFTEEHFNLMLANDQHDYTVTKERHSGVEGSTSAR